MDIKNKEKKGRSKLNAIFFNQIKNFKDLGCSKKNIEILIRKYREVQEVLDNLDLNPTMEEFIAVIPSSCWNKRSIITIRKKIMGIKEKKISEVFSRSKENEPYFIIGVEKGEKTSNMLVSEVFEKLGKEATIVNTEEMLSIAIHSDALDNKFLQSRDRVDQKLVNLAKQDGKILIYLGVDSRCFDWGTPYYLKKV